jgi:hypothetical protein
MSIKVEDVGAGKLVDAESCRTGAGGRWLGDAPSCPIHHPEESHRMYHVMYSQSEFKEEAGE